MSDESTEKPGTDNTEASPFDSLASAYDAWFDGEGKLAFATEVRAFQEVLPSLPKPWLEVGVGSGRFARALGIDTGVDPSVKLLELAKRRGIAAFPGRGEQLPFGGGGFGTVFLIVTLCFVASPVDIFKEAYRILAPGGKVVLGLVLKESPWGKLYQQKKQQGHLFYQYASFYRYDEVVSLLEQAGFSVGQVISTLFQEPGRVERIELPQEGYSPDAGFTIMVAGKQAIG